MRSGRRLRLAIAALAIVLAVVGLAMAARVGRSDAGAWAPVRRDDLVLGVELTGTLRAVDSELLGPPQRRDLWQFKIVRLAPEGTLAKKGQPVLGFDTSEFQRTLLEKEAERDQAQKEIEKRETDLLLKHRDDELQIAEAEARSRKAALKVDVPSELSEAKELARSRIDRAAAENEIAALRSRVTAAARGAEAELAQLRAKRDWANGRVQEIREALTAMTVKAPRDGTVIYIEDRRGEKKKIGDTCWRMEKVVEIPDLTRMRADGEVDEADAGQIQVGQRITFRLDAHPDIEFGGRIEAIQGAVERASPTSPLKVVRVRLALDRTDTERMRPGMRLRGTVEIGRVPGTLLVPAETVFPSPEGPIAWRRTLLGMEPVALHLGRRNRTAVEVTGGLAEGDRVSRVAPSPSRSGS